MQENVLILHVIHFLSSCQCTYDIRLNGLSGVCLSLILLKICPPVCFSNLVRSAERTAVTTLATTSWKEKKTAVRPPIRDGNEPKKFVSSRIEPSRPLYRGIIEPSHFCFEPSRASGLSLSSRAVLLHSKFLIEPKNLLFSKSSRGGCKSCIFLLLFFRCVQGKGRSKNISLSSRAEL